MQSKKLQRIAALEASAFRCIARGRQANIELGHVFNQLKRVVGHGRWQRYFEQKFAPKGITLRTAENYMRLAAKDVARSIGVGFQVPKALTPKPKKPAHSKAGERAVSGVIGRQEEVADVVNR